MARLSTSQRSRKRPLRMIPTLAELRPQFTSFWTVTTEPPDAHVYAKPYDRPQEDWKNLGRSPLEQARLPQGFFRWRVTKEGCTPVEGYRDPVQGRIQFILDTEGSLPPGMVRVSGNAYREKSDDSNDPNVRSTWKTTGSTAARSRTGSSRSLWIRVGTESGNTGNTSMIPTWLPQFSARA